MSASVKVAVRVRPFNEREVKMNCMCVVEVKGNTTCLLSSKTDNDDAIDTKEFTFDYSYWSHNTDSPHFASQEKVYNDLGSSVVSNGLQGYNACVFAYGQTGSGKTFTMMGSQNNPGLTPRICKSLFSSMEKGREFGTTYKVEVSYLEIYNEKVKDLLSIKGETNKVNNLKVREHRKYGPYVENLSQHVVTQYSDVQELMQRGNNCRTTASTNMNDSSSRSHAIFTLTFIQAKLQADVPLETRSKINLVDLAGSERADATGAVGKRLKEGSHINKSLVTLGIVISALADQGMKTNKKPHIPYRDSVLTFLLKDSLGGNSKTIMIATISPADVNYGETLGTLRYANRAKNIINKPTINEDANVKLIKELRAEIAKLKSMIGGESISLPNGGGVEEGTILATLSLKEAQEKELTDKWTEKWRQTQHILQEQKTLELRKAGESGRGVVLDSERPHLVLYDDDLGSTGLTLYHLNDEVTTIGASQDQDIQLEGQGMLDEHCVIKLGGEKATLERLITAEVIVNDQVVKDSVKLIHGAMIMVGGSHVFRYNDPQEAARIRKQGNRSSMNLSRLSFLSRSTTDLIRSYDSLPGSTTNVDMSSSVIKGLGERRATDDAIIHRRNETALFCEISTQTSNSAQSHPGSPVVQDPSISLNLKKKYSLTLPLDGGSESREERESPSLDSTPASDTFYTATSILTPDVSDLTPLSPEGSCMVERGSQPAPIRINPHLAQLDGDLNLEGSPIRPAIGAVLNSPGAVAGGVTSTPKASRTAPKNVGRENQISTEERNNGASSSNSDVQASSNFSEPSDLINLDDDSKKIYDVLAKLHGCKIEGSSENQSEAVRDLRAHYLSAENRLLVEQEKRNGEGKEKSEREGASAAAGRVTRPDVLPLASVLKEERIALLIEMEVQRRVMEEMVNRRCRVHDPDEACQCQCGNRMVRSSSPNSLRSVPRVLSPSELRPYSSLSAECAYDYVAARSVMYQSRASADDLLLSPVPLHSPLDADYEMACGVCVTIPSFELKGCGSTAHWEYLIQISVGIDSWTMFRRYRRFRELHLFMCHKYGTVIQDLYFPPRRLFGNNSLVVIEKRRKELEVYLQQLITLCSDMEGSPLCDVAPSRELLEKFSPFFYANREKQSAAS